MQSLSSLYEADWTTFLIILGCWKPFCSAVVCVERYATSLFVRSAKNSNIARVTLLEKCKRNLQSLCGQFGFRSGSTDETLVFIDCAISVCLLPIPFFGSFQ